MHVLRPRGTIWSFSIADGNGSENVTLKINSRFLKLRRVYSNLQKMAICRRISVEMIY